MWTEQCLGAARAGSDLGSSAYSLGNSGTPSTALRSQMRFHICQAMVMLKLNRRHTQPPGSARHIVNAE